MNRKKEIRDELQELSPFLSSMKEKEQPFTVPKDYFKQLPDEILAKVQPEKMMQKETQVSWLDRFVAELQWLLQPRPALALATVAILIMAGIFFFNNSTPAVSDVQWADISEEEINAYVASNIEEFETDLLWQHSSLDADDELSTELEFDDEELDVIIDEIIDDLPLEDIEELL